MQVISKPTPGTPRDVTEGNLWASIWKLSWPMLVIMVFQFFVGVTDVFVAGIIDSRVQAAVGFTGHLYFLFIIAGHAIGIGTVSIMARAAGGGDFKRALTGGKQSVILGGAVALAAAATVVLFRRQIIAAAGIPSEIQPFSETFLVLFAAAMVPNYLLIITNALFRSVGEVQKPLCSMAVFAIVNIVGDFALVFGFPGFSGIGYAGIALSTALAATAATALNFFFLFGGRWRPFYSLAWRPRVTTMKAIVTLSWPAALHHVAWNAGTIVLYNILGRLGDASVTAIAAITNGLRIEAILFLPAVAFNMAAAVIIGQNLGAGQSGRAERAGWRIAGAGLLVVSFMAAFIFVYAGSLAAFFTSNEEVWAETTRYLRINMLSAPFMAVGLILVGGLQGAGDTRGSMWIVVISMWLVRLPLAAILVCVAGFDALGVWSAMVVSMIIQGALTGLRFRRGHWKTLRIE